MSRCKAGYGRHFVGLQGCELKKWEAFRQKAGLGAEKKAAKLCLEAAKKFAKRPNNALIRANFALVLRFWQDSRKRVGGARSGNAVPTGLCVNCWFRPPHPTLKRGANNHCAYGAGDEQLPGLSGSIQAPLRGHQP
jgi:hypothetical protein